MNSALILVLRSTDIQLGVDVSKTREFLDNLTHEQLLDRLSLALDGAALGIWDWDLGDDSVQFDRRWCEMLGLDHASTPMVLQTWSDRVHPDDLDGCYRDIQAHLRGDAPHYENVHRMRHADGEWRYILDRGRISGWDEGGKPIRFTGTHLDITESERARLKLHSHQRELVGMIEHLPTAVALFDCEVRYLAASAQWLRSRGCPSDYRGKGLYELEPQIHERWRRVHRRALEGEVLEGDEDEVVQADGSSRWFRWSVRPWRSGDVVSGIVIGFDEVTPTVLARRAREEEARAKLAALALFAGGVAHEINTPLQIVSLEAELLQAGLTELRADPDALAALRRSADVIATTTARAAAIANALRTLARDTSKDPEEPVAVATLFLHADALCRARCESQGIELSFHDPDRAVASGRPAELLHVLTNLLDNAIHAAAAGERWVRVEAEARDEAVVLRCVDGGPGIPDRDRARLGTPFFTTKPAGKGNGLGLALVRHLVERGRGTLELPSGLPTTFAVALPAAERG